MNSVMDNQQSGATPNRGVLKPCGGKDPLLSLFLMSLEVAPTCAPLGARVSRKVMIVPLSVFFFASSRGHWRPAADGYSNRPEPLGGV